MLAHKAEDEGVMVAELIAGQNPHIDYNCIPWVIYTSPEIAWVGKTEQQLKADGRGLQGGAVSVRGQRPRAGHRGSRRASSRSLADAKTDEMLGVHIVGPMASELIAEAVVAMEFKASGRGHRAHLPRASVAVGGDPGSGAGGRQARAELLSRPTALVTRRASP